MTRSYDAHNQRAHRPRSTSRCSWDRPAPRATTRSSPCSLPVDVFDVLSFALEAKPARRARRAAREGPRHRGRGQHRRPRSAGAGEADGLGLLGTGDDRQGHTPCRGHGGRQHRCGYRATGGLAIDPRGRGTSTRPTTSSTSWLGGWVRMSRSSSIPRPAIGRGIGDLLQPLSLPELPLVLIFTDQPLSTAHVYREFDTRRTRRRTRPPSPPVRRRPMRSGGRCRPSRCGELLRNDLEETSCNLLPGLCDAKDRSCKKGRSGRS